MTKGLPTNARVEFGRRLSSDRIILDVHVVADSGVEWLHERVVDIMAEVWSYKTTPTRLTVLDFERQQLSRQLHGNLRWWHPLEDEFLDQSDDYRIWPQLADAAPPFRPTRRVRLVDNPNGPGRGH